MKSCLQYLSVWVFRETNLKVRQAIPETAELGDDISQLSRFDGN